MSLFDKFEIDSAIRQERYYRDTTQLEKLRAMWHPDNSKTLVEISWIKGTVDDWIKGSRVMAATGVGAMHTMQPAEILIKGDKALATSTISIQGRSSYKGTEFDVVSWAHQKQRFEKVEGAWLIVRLEVIYIRDHVLSLFPGQKIPELDEKSVEILKTARPSLKHLAWHLSLIGNTVGNDLPGYDDERTWRPIEERNLRWLESETEGC